MQERRGTTLDDTGPFSQFLGVVGHQPVTHLAAGELAEWFWTGGLGTAPWQHPLEQDLCLLLYPGSQNWVNE